MVVLAQTGCFPESSPISACETESTMSRKHDANRWADIADSDDESTDISMQEQCTLPRTQSDAASTQSFERCSLGMNIEAPEFVPTLSHCCPLSGVIDVIPENETGLLNEAGPAFYDTGFSVLASSSGCSSNGKSSKRSKGRKQRPAPLEVSRHQQHVDLELPPATEEEWQRRLESRSRSIMVGKTSAEYISFMESKTIRQSESEDNFVEPLTPDPTDRSISKRRWKYEIQVWREMLKVAVAAKASGSDSMASTEEWQSQATNTTEADDFEVIDGDDVPRVC